MENRKVLVDTSIIIEYLRSNNRKDATFIKLFEKYDLNLSVVSVFELFNGATTESKKNDIEKILNNIETIHLTKEMAILSSEIYKNLKSKNKVIEFRDILIASSSLYYNIPIATLNIKHFERIENLQIINL